VDLALRVRYLVAKPVELSVSAILNFFFFDSSSILERNCCFSDVSLCSCTLCSLCIPSFAFWRYVKKSFDIIPIIFIFFHDLVHLAHIISRVLLLFALLEGREVSVVISIPAIDVVNESNPCTLFQ